MHATECPTHADLVAYRSKTLPPGLAETVADHLGACPACLAATLAGEPRMPSTLAEGGPDSGTETPSATIPADRPESSSTGLSVETVVAPSTGGDGTVAGEGGFGIVVGGGDGRPGRGRRLDVERGWSAAGAVVGGRYTLVRAIGEGGMGSVYLAQQTEPVRRQVAVKFIKAGMSTREVLARFDAERQALALMDHPNIAKVLDAGASADGRPFFVMELVRGEPITRYCDDQRLTVRDRLDLFLPVCRAVQHAHQKGVIHRDLKPSNVLVARYDGRPVPKVIDFGVAKAAGQPLTDRTLMTGLGAVVGTLQYMAPEQAGLSQVDIDTRADVYALGVLLYELLTGTTPLDRARLGESSLLELLRSVREEEPPRPSVRLGTDEDLPAIAAVRGSEPRRLTAAVRGELDWIVMKALEKDRGRRYETASGLARDVERFLADEPVEAGRPSARYRLGKLARRHKAALRGAGASLLLLVAATAVSAWQAIRATRAEQLERVERLRSESRYALARDAVEAFYRGASEDVLLKEPLLRDLRARLLGAALEFHRKLQDEGGSKPELAAGYERVAELSAEIGSKREALAGYERALALRRDLADQSTGDPGPRRDLARVYARIGDVRFALDPPEVAADWHRRALAEHEAVARMTGEVGDRLDAAADQVAIGQALSETKQADESLAAFGRATRALRDLDRSAPGDPRPRRALSLALQADGLSRQNNLSRPSEAIALLRESNGLLESLASGDAGGPDGVSLRLNWARGLHWLGVSHYQVGEHDDSLASYRRSLDVIGPVAGRYPTILAVRRSIADTRLGIGITLAEVGRPRDALDEYRKAQQVYEALVEENRPVPIYRQRLAASLNSMALVLDTIGDERAAATAYERSISLRERLAEEDPSTLLNSYMLAENYGHFAGHHRRWGRRGLARAWYLKTVAALEGLPAGNVLERYNRACFLASVAELTPVDPARPTPAEAAESGAMADRAMIYLRDAVANGYRSVDWMDRDTDLDVLRGRDDFRSLRMDMIFPAAPFAP